jgi:hypothetical protein
MDTVQANAMVAAGAAVTKQGRSCLNVPAFYPFQQDLAASETRLDLTQSVDTDADFYWRGWKWIDHVDADTTTAGYTLLARFGLLNGYYLANTMFPGIHFNLRSVTPELRITAGGFIKIEAQNTDVVTRKLKIIFFGVKRYYLDK